MSTAGVNGPYLYEKNWQALSWSAERCYDLTETIWGVELRRQKERVRNESF
jgi:hypothetical protein